MKPIAQNGQLDSYVPSLGQPQEKKSMYETCNHAGRRWIGNDWEKYKQALLPKVPDKAQVPRAGSFVVLSHFSLVL